MKNIAVAIDGPAGAGKSSISKAIAKELKFIYIDTGAMYRAVGLKALTNELDTKNDIIKVIDMLKTTNISIKHYNDGQHIFLDGEDVTDKIRTPMVSIAASDVSAIPEVRKSLVEIQRKLSYENNVIMDGRDIGTYVLPKADVKIFLTASVEKRAKRRYDEMLANGAECDYDAIRNDIEYRDKNDSTREFAPLKPADGSIIIDNSDINFEQSVSLLIKTIKERL